MSKKEDESYSVTCYVLIGCMSAVVLGVFLALLVTILSSMEIAEDDPLMLQISTTTAPPIAVPLPRQSPSRKVEVVEEEVQFEIPKALQAFPKTLGVELAAAFECSSRCTRMTAGDRGKIDELKASVGCRANDQGYHVVCASSHEQLCLATCGGGQQDMATYMPGSFGPNSPDTTEAEFQAFAAAISAHNKCAEECRGERVVVQPSLPRRAQRALQILQKCGFVQLPGAFDLQLLGALQKAVDELVAKHERFQQLHDNKQLHDGRSQVYLPHKPPFTSREAIGANDLVLEVLSGYFGSYKRGFGIDHVTVLTSASGSGNQSLHPDVHYFKGLSVSVHTALVDVTEDMGPTYFCPCTGEMSNPKEWPVSAAIKMTMLRQKECLAAPFHPQLTKKGTITIYDGAMFHKGLANRSPRDRPVLKLEVAGEGFVDVRNYIQGAPAAAQRQVMKFRKSMGPPKFSASSSKTEL